MTHWTELSHDELTARLIQRGIAPEWAKRLVADHEDDAGVAATIALYLDEHKEPNDN